MSWSVGSFDEWFLGFAYSQEGMTLVRRVATRFGLGPAIVDDLRQEWVLAVRKTVANRARGPDLLIDFVDSESVMSYVTRALRNRAIDLLRKDQRAPEPMDAERIALRSASGDASSSALRNLSLSAEAVFIEREWCELVRQEITRELHTGKLRCPGCPAARVVQIALYAVNVCCDSPEPRTLPAWAAEIQGGSRELDRVIYQALFQMFPEHAERADDGRLATSTRKMKQRCGECVRDLLSEIALRCHTLMSGAAVSDVDGDERV